jgi:hypothetical protein
MIAGDDYLAALSVQQVAAWYRRLADQTSKKRIDGQEPLAAIFLRRWLDNRNPNSVFQFQAPSYLRSSSFVTSVRQYHRAVFLTEQRARFTSGRQAWAGVVPRLQGTPGFTPWDVRSNLQMDYESLVEIGSNAVEIARIQYHGTPAERDLLASLRGFQLRSRVSVSGARLANSQVRITFVSWFCRVTDRYDFDYHERFTVENPDHNRTSADAVRPQDRFIRVYHTNARRVEQAGLAAPYNLTSDEWRVSDAAVLRPADVDHGRRL